MTYDQGVAFALEKFAARGAFNVRSPGGAMRAVQVGAPPDPNQIFRPAPQQTPVKPYSPAAVAARPAPAAAPNTIRGGRMGAAPAQPGQPQQGAFSRGMGWMNNKLKTPLGQMVGQTALMMGVPMAIGAVGNMFSGNTNQGQY